MTTIFWISLGNGNVYSSSKSIYYFIIFITYKIRKLYIYRKKYNFTKIIKLRRIMSFHQNTPVMQFYIKWM